MVPILTDPNDQVKGWTGVAEEVALPPECVASEALAYLDSVEFHSVTDHRIRLATGSDDSLYLGVVSNTGGIAAGHWGNIMRAVTLWKTATGAITQGQRVIATDHDHVQAAVLCDTPYLLCVNDFGLAMEDAIDGAQVRIRVEPTIRH